MQAGRSPLCSAALLAFLYRYQKMPFENNPRFWNAIPDPDARKLVQSLLKTRPQDRATTSALLRSPLLAGMELLPTD